MDRCLSELKGLPAKQYGKPNREFESLSVLKNIYFMSKNKKPTRKQEEDYMSFLKKRLDSKNYKASVPVEEYEKTKAKYDKVKLKLKLL